MLDLVALTCERDMGVAVLFAPVCRLFSPPKTTTTTTAATKTAMEAAAKRASLENMLVDEESVG